MKKFTAHNTLWLLISILPLMLLIGSGVINTSIVIIDLVFIYIVFKQKKIDFNDKLILYVFIFFWLSLIINLLFSLNFNNSFDPFVVGLKNVAIPYGSLFIHAIFYKIFGLYGLIVVNYIAILLFLIIF